MKRKKIIAWQRLPKRAPPVLLIISFVLIGLLFFLPSCSSGQGSPLPSETTGPRIFFAKDADNIGEVPLDVAINYAFHFKNVGSQPLNIIGVQAKVFNGC
ncbi:hypothetical protein ACFLX0_02380 [Chloroflexota bacterium]